MHMDQEARTRFGAYLRSLRGKKGLTQREVAHQAQISNAYLAQVENGLRNPPSREVLSRLAPVYDVSEQKLWEEAGYEGQTTARVPASIIERAFEFVCNDERYAFGTRLKGSTLTLEAKAYIVEVYQTATNRILLFDKEFKAAYEEE